MTYDEAEFEREYKWLETRQRNKHDPVTREGLNRLNADLQKCAEQLALYPEVVAKLETFCIEYPATARLIGADDVLVRAREVL